MRTRLLCAAALAACLLLGGCGVPSDREPRPIEPSVVIGSYEGPIGGPPPSAGAAIERLFLVRDNQLIAVDRRVAAAPSPEKQLDDLMAGPTPEERDEGLDSALIGTNIITGVQLRNGTAIVGLARDNPIRNDEIVAYGQIVCTLSARADVVGVRFVQDGRPVEIPRADGALTQEMLTEGDYGSLIQDQ
ncbi:GerMN domain-containing protein [Dactylosporangium sp. NPDC048998]|uniref:GerMN domain-containing protein n=1 Tax=Dactylosporangium sp. NPDC048998 TaxID=3363976 RepID=UPI003714ADED